MRFVLLSAACALFALTSSHTATADTSKTQTTWTFHVGYSTGQSADWDDPSAEGPVTMYTGSSWRCGRERMTLTENGNLLAGFICVQPAGTGQIFIRASCPGTADGSDYAAAIVSDSTTKSWARLTVGCISKRERRAPARPAAATESNL